MIKIKLGKYTEMFILNVTHGRNLLKVQHEAGSVLTRVANKETNH